MSVKNKNGLGQSKMKKRISNSALPWLLPLLSVLVFVFLFPVVEIVRLSFTNATLNGGEYSYTLDSYISLFTNPGFMQMLIVTGIFVFFSITFQMLFGFLVALIIDQGEKWNLKGTVLTRTAVLTAWAIPGVIIGVIWQMLYNETDAGIINYLLSIVGIGPVPFLSDPTTALIAVTFANVWRGTAFSMILIYAGLKTLPSDVIEAAKIDGANAIQRGMKVILPMLTPMLLINLVIISIDTFNTFDMVMALTGGGPGQSTEVISLSIYNSIFNQFNLGQGAATSVVLLTINVAMTIVYILFLGRGEKNAA
ncbi:carbohydrate ABC transporter permease [Lentibacillus salicampi]|uniref:Sugar ABC transporter permease n=1 Tax=Lentibacillus salicampi TaxID=175306 RepID=A0A4Y9AA42_9BACI|nr:sugar ABC transporter permease [Lentibacillus salicampi]TFJ92192.1 sugar ABC transporter permease [Lentibacillus salicampi]